MNYDELIAALSQLKGNLQGAGAGLAGLPVDLAELGVGGLNAVLEASHGVPAPDMGTAPEGGSSWMIEQMGGDLSDPAVLAGLLLTPTPGGKVKKAKEAVKRAKGVFQEYKYPKLAEPIAQIPLPRRTHTPTGKEVKRPPTIDQIFTPERIREVEDVARRGMDVGGHKWYWSGGIEDEFIRRLGERRGREEFQQFMALGAAMSPRSKVAQELKRASVLRNRLRNDQPIHPLTPDMFPPGYGHMATSTAHAPAVGRLVETGAVGTGEAQPKISSYAQNKMGNYQPLTADTHNFKMWSGMDRGPTPGEYPFVEEIQSAAARKLGLDPAEYQSATWVGAADDTGVANSQNITAAMNERIAATAAADGITEAEALDRFIIDATILKSLLAGIGTPLVASSMMPGRTEEN